MAQGSNIIDRFSRLAEMWYLREPAFFAIYCINELRENPHMDCAIRCGKGRVEYNADYIKPLNDNQLEELMKAEMIRIFLKHPYSRRPINCSNEKMILASDMTLHGQYDFVEYKFVDPGEFELECGKSYEYYLTNIPEPESDINANADDGNGDDDSKQSEESQSTSQSDDNQSTSSDNEGDASSGCDSDVPGSKSDRSALWEEDDERSDAINELIEQLNSSDSWGSIPGELKEKIVASSRAKIDYRKTLSGFRASILSTKRHLTRMRPNRRFEFQQMGSKYDLETQLLIAVDTSASISNSDLENFYGVMQRMFRYGVSQIDVIQFDCKLQTPKPITLKNAKQLKINGVKGRGGTDFHVAFDYLRDHNFYDGMIIFTDGYASKPQIDFFTRAKFAWVLPDEKCYNEHKDWMGKMGRVCFLSAK